MFELYVVETVAVSTLGIALACRVHSETVHLGDRVTKVSDAQGNSWPVNLEVRQMNMTGSIEVDSLEENYGGLVTLFGLCGSVEPGLTLHGTGGCVGEQGPF